ncbi:MAG: GDSL-type esterase/lipase family protein [Pseudomonadota bacterium]|nr:GDSL-type esterase/lipase family protein [Pseudomonadota bacterium]
MKRLRHLPAPWIAFSLILLLLSGCGNEAPLPALPMDGRILAFGDSLTRGTGAKPEASYPAVLERLSGRQVVNAGIPGEESDAGLTRLPGLLEGVEPNLVILGHGGNDMLRKRDLAGAETNLRQMVQLVLDRGASVVLLGIPKPGIFLGTHPMYERIAASMEIPLEENALEDILGDSALKSDPIHPNATGYQELAMALHRLLVERGAL